MKNHFIPFALAIVSGLFITTHLFAQTTHNIKLSEKISVTFPQEPEKQDFEGVAQVYNLRLADSTANFLAVVSNLEKQAGLDAATLAEASLMPEFWDQAADGFMAQMGADAKLKNRAMKNIKGFDVMELTIERQEEGQAGLSTLTIYIFVQDVYSFNIGHSNRGGKADPKIKEAFFNSIVIAD
jgi:hypothetical protein